MRSRLTLSKAERKAFFFIGDIALVILSIYIFSGYVLRGSYSPEQDLPKIVLISISLFVFLAISLDLYNIKRMLKANAILPFAFFVGLIYTLCNLIITVFIVNTTVSRLYLIVYLLGIPFLFALSKLLLIKLFPFELSKKVLVIFEDSLNKEKVNLIEGANKINGYEVKLSLSLSSIESTGKHIFKKALKKIDAVILDTRSAKKIPQEIEKIIISSLMHKKEFFTFNYFFEKTYEALPMDLHNERFYELIQLSNKKTKYFNALFSLLANFVLCVLVGSVLIIFIPIISFLNLFFNRGPLFYSQKRIGRQGKEFSIYKFRSMIKEAEKSGAKMATKNDTRITPLGRILRATRIDELPQIISILKGDMTFIGPRPERKVFVDKLNEKTPFYDVRHIVKPGITGWAQVNYKYGENLQDSIKKLEYDLYYIKNNSIVLDVRILFRTITTVLFGKGT